MSRLKRMKVYIRIFVAGVFVVLGTVGFILRVRAQFSTAPIEYYRAQVLRLETERRIDVLEYEPCAIGWHKLMRNAKAGRDIVWFHGVEYKVTWRLHRL